MSKEYRMTKPAIRRKNIKSLPNLAVEQGQMGDGSSPISLSRTDIRRALSGLPVSRRHSPRQAEFSAS